MVASASQKGILCTIKDASEIHCAVLVKVVGDGFGGEGEGGGIVCVGGGGGVGEGVAVGIEGVGVDGEKLPAFQPCKSNFDYSVSSDLESLLPVHWLRSRAVESAPIDVATAAVA